MAATSDVDRDALLRFLELKNDLAFIGEAYRDLGLPVIAAAMHAAGYELYACAFLPRQASVPADEAPAP